MSMDLDQDYNINGHSFRKGKNVDTTVQEVEVDDNGKRKSVKRDYAQAIKEAQEAGANSAEYINTHHGAVPAPADPQEATAQTPTRPLAAPNVRVTETVKPSVENSGVIEVKDASADGKGRSANESNMDVVEDKEGEIVVSSDPDAPLVTEPEQKDEKKK